MHSTKQNAADSIHSIASQTTHQNAEMVQIPAAALATLISSIEGLRKDVSSLENKTSNSDELQGDFSKLHDTIGRTLCEISSLQHNSSETFPQFQQLPVEIRRMIWGHAFSEPQLVVIGDVFCTRSHFNNVVLSCREARDEAKLQLDYFTTDLSPSSKQYINNHLDTIWLAAPGSPVLPQEIDMRCGNCSGCSGEPWRSNDRLFCKETCPKYRNKSYGPIGKLAIQNDEWFAHFFPEEGLDPENMFSMEILFQHNVKELFLVIDSIPVTPPESVTFVEPAKSPSEVEADALGFEVAVGASWRKLAERTMEEMKKYKDKLLSDQETMITRIILNQRGLDDGGIGYDAYGGQYFDEDGSMDSDFSAYLATMPEEQKLKLKDPDNIAAWEVPKITFVEAKVKSEKWAPYRDQSEHSWEPRSRGIPFPGPERRRYW